MSLKYIVFLLILIFSSSIVIGATIHGTIYDSNMDPLKQVVVKVNSTPQQRHITKYGGYHFELETGRYRIYATFGNNENEILVAEEFIEVKGTGDYIVDLFANSNMNITNQNDLNTNNNARAYFFLSGGLLIICLIIGISVFFYYKKNKTKKLEYHYNQKEFDLTEHINHDNLNKIVSETEIEPFESIKYNINYPGSETDILNTEKNNSENIDFNKKEKTNEILDNLKIEAIDTKDSVETIIIEEDALKKRIINIIKKNENQIILQKEIRKKIDLSESKISQTISELEKEGIIQKIKKGRSNFIKLIEN